jgi:CDP-diacylglycerol--glycerol-3-phosphate 3-phosphatidyltransferase
VARLGAAGPGRAQLAQRWAAAHPGHSADQSPLLRCWLRGVWPIGAALSRAGVPPDALSAAGVGAAAAGALLARHPSRAARLGAAAALLASGAADGLDGAIAIHRAPGNARAARRGAAVDRAADRIADACWAWAIRECGAPRWAVAGLVVASTAQEAAREALGARLHGVVTVSERPTRLICAVIAASAAAAAPRRRWPAGVCAGVWAGTALVAGRQLISAARHQRG